MLVGDGNNEGEEYKEGDGSGVRVPAADSDEVG